MNLLSIKTTCAAVVLLSACSVNDQTIMESEHNAIGFHLTGSMAETRATPTTPTSPQQTLKSMLSLLTAQLSWVRMTKVLVIMVY